MMKNQERNVLITYSSGYGTTREVAYEIAEIFAENPSLNINIKPIDNVNSIDSYDSIIVGTSVRADHLLANTRDFFAINHKILADKKVAFFCVCLTANSPEGREKVISEYVPQIFSKYENIKPIGIAAFGGKIDFNKLNPVMQSLVKQVYQKTGIKGEGSVDSRDWEMIREWAQEIRDKIVQDEA